MKFGIKYKNYALFTSESQAVLPLDLFERVEY